MSPYRHEQQKKGENMNDTNKIDTPVARKIQHSLQNWTHTIANLEHKAKQMESEARDNMNKHIQTLKKQKEDLEEKFSSLSKAGSSATKDLQQGVEKSYETMSQSVDDAIERFNLV